MAETADAAELLGVEVQQFAGTLALVAWDRLRRLERLQAVQAEPAQDAGDGRDRNAELAGDCGRAHPLPAQPFDLGHPLGREGAELRSWRAGSPPARQRRTHLPTVSTLTPKSAATFWRRCLASMTRRTMRSRLCGVARAFLWMFIRSFQLGC